MAAEVKTFDGGRQSDVQVIELRSPTADPLGPFMENFYINIKSASDEAATQTGREAFRALFSGALKERGDLGRTLTRAVGSRAGYSNYTARVLKDCAERQVKKQNVNSFLAGHAMERFRLVQPLEAQAIALKRHLSTNTQESITREFQVQMREIDKMELERRRLKNAEKEQEKKNRRRRQQRKPPVEGDETSRGVRLQATGENSVAAARKALAERMNRLQRDRINAERSLAEVQRRLALLRFDAPGP